MPAKAGGPLFREIVNITFGEAAGTAAVPRWVKILKGGGFKRAFGNQLRIDVTALIDV